MPHLPPPSAGNLNPERRCSSDCLNDGWFKKGKVQYKDLDWEMEIDRFHLNNDRLNKELLETVQAI